MALIVNDTFTEASDTGIASHTADTGGGWGIVSGSATVRGGLGYISEGNSGADNRPRLSTGLSGSPAVYTATLVVSEVVGGMGSKLVGIRARIVDASAGGVNTYFAYDGFNSQFNLTDGSTNNASVEAWTGNNTTLALVVTATTLKGYVNGVLKCSLNSTVGAGNNFIGLEINNFAGGGTDTIRITSFQVDNTDLFAPASPGSYYSYYRSMVSEVI
jgi:hypothetical protein